MIVFHSSCLPVDYDMAKVVFIEQIRHAENNIGNYSFSKRSCIDADLDQKTVAVFIVKPKQSKS